MKLTVPIIILQLYAVTYCKRGATEHRESTQVHGKEVLDEIKDEITKVKHDLMDVIAKIKPDAMDNTNRMKADSMGKTIKLEPESMHEITKREREAVDETKLRSNKIGDEIGHIQDTNELEDMDKRDANKRVSEFALVAHAKECGGKEIDVGKFKTVDECAAQCAAESMMFAFGTNDFGENKCKKKYFWWGDIQCPCYCETESSARGECPIIRNDGYNLYRFSAQVPELCPRSLPQYMTDNVCIQKNQFELYRAKMFFKFTKANDVVHFPRLDQPPHAVHAQLAFSETKEVALSSALVVMKQAIYKIGAGLTQVFGDARLKTYEQYQFMYKEMMKQLKGLHLGPQIDMVPDYDGFTDVVKDEKWKEDRIFAQRRLAGICPFFLQQVTTSDNIGIKKEKLESLLNPDFDWNSAVKEAIGDTQINSLDQAISAGRVYVLYHDYFNDIFRMASHESGRTPINTTSTVSVFVTDQNGDLNVVAIQEDYRRDSKVHSPKSPPADWEKAKALVEMEESGHCQAIGHLYECHVRMEIICNTQPKHMSPTHPLYELMRQHCMGTESLGYFGADRVLLVKGGSFDKLFQFGHQGALHMMNHVFDNDHYDRMDLELRLKNQGLINDNLKYYPYRDDGLVLWRGVQVFAERIVSAYYVTDEDVAKDSEVQNLMNELSRDGKRTLNGGKGPMRGVPTEMKSKKELSTFLARFLLPVIQHSAANYPIYPYVMYYPMQAGLLFEPQGEENMLNMMPNATTVIESTVQGAMLASLRMNKLFDYSNQLTDDKTRDIVRDTFRHFHVDIQTKLAARNAKRFKEGKLTFQYFEPAWMTNSIHV